MLSDQEKEVGRLWRSEQITRLTLLNEDPETAPDYVFPVHQGIPRHLCPKRKNRSTALGLREVYVHSPELVAKDGTVIPAGRFGFHYKEGHCTHCKQSGRTKEGVFEDAYARPPLEGRVAR